jgi:dihydrofolate reductase
MRKLSAGLFMSIDGVVESPNLWQFDSFDDELGAQMGQLLGRVDTAILGRVGYQEWAGFWPNAEDDDPFGGFINPIEKFVASRTLTGDLKWQNSALIDGDVEAFLIELKKTDGGEISLFSSISLVRQLLFSGVLDSLTLMIHPVIAGSGRRLFEATDPTTRLELVESTITSKGNAVLTYSRRSN